MCVRTALAFYPRCFWVCVIVNPLEATSLPRSLLNLYCTSHRGAYVAWFSLLFPPPRCSRAHPSVTWLSQQYSRGRMMVALFLQIFLSRRVCSHYQKLQHHYVLLPFIFSRYFLFFYLILQKGFNYISYLAFYEVFTVIHLFILCGRTTSFEVAPFIL